MGLGGKDDTDNWHTEETGFKTTWTMYRWLPKYEFIVDYYKDSFRFTPATNDVKTWAYNSANAVTYALDVQNAGNYVTLTSALSGFTASVTALFTSLGLLNF